MEAGSESLFICTKSECVKTYNDYLKIVREVNQDIEALQNKAKHLQQAVEQLTNAHPTEMVKTDTWPKLKQANKHTSSATKQIIQTITMAKQVANAAEQTAREIEK